MKKILKFGKGPYHLKVILTPTSINIYRKYQYNYELYQVYHSAEFNKEGVPVSVMRNQFVILKQIIFGVDWKEEFKKK